MSAKVVMLVLVASAINLVGFSVRVGATEDACFETSQFAKKACYNAADEVRNLALGKCENLREDSRQQKDCETAAETEKADSKAECLEQFDARQEVCVAVGPGPYLPDGIKPFKFVSKDQLIGNSFFPLTPATYTFKSFDSNGNVIENSVVKVTTGTRKILGVACRAVQDTVYEGETQKKKIEDTTDWYAQDTKGNVWYFGEIAQNFNDEGILDNLDGSWAAGVEGAKPGIIMFADPNHPPPPFRKTYRQEFALGEAEDVATVVGIVDTLPALPASVSLPNGVKGPFLHTQEFTAFSPEVVEDKYYARGVGLVLVVAEDGTKEVLVKISKP
jgi:hypothetical protein